MHYSTLPSFLFTNATRLSLVFALAAPLSPARAQYFLRHLPSGLGVSVEATPDGGARMMAGTSFGTELVFDASGEVINSTQVQQTVEGSVYLRRLLPFGPGMRLGFGGLDDQLGIGIRQSILLTRIADGANTADAVVIGTPEGQEYNGDAVVIPGEGVVVTGTIGFGGSTDLRYHLFVAKFDMDLNALRMRTVDVQEKNLSTLNVLVDPTTGVITCFTRQSPLGAVDNSLARVRLSATGEVLDCIVYDHPGNGWENMDVVPLDDGAFLLLQELTGFETFQLVCTRIEADGEVTWSRLVSAPGDTELAEARLYDGAIYLLGTTVESFTEQYVTLVKMDLEANVEWTHTYGDAARWNVGYCLAVGPDGAGGEAIWVGGTYRLSGSSPQKILVMKVDGNGEGLPCTRPDLVFTTTPTEISTTTGFTSAPYTTVSPRNLIVGTYPDQEFTTVCGIVGIGETPMDPELHAAPVPTTGPCTLQLSAVSHAQQMRLVDAHGRTLSTHQVAAGTRTMHLDLSPYPAGLYAAVLEEPRSGTHKTVRLVKE
ncbi:MAG: hypothetical protein JNJ91_11205 [Flavobacteriales bacterium]|nr:hypothetical protein [Flavobacteriales bacterium]